MTSSLPPHLAPASKLLGHIQGALGTTARVHYTNECLHLIYNREITNVASLLEPTGVVIECNLLQPGNGAAANEEMVIGNCDGATFMARSFREPESGPLLEIHIYANDGKQQVRSDRLEALYRMADAVFRTHESADRALLSYVARRLDADQDTSETTEFVAGLNDIITGFLKSQLPQSVERLVVHRRKSSK